MKNKQDEPKKGSPAYMNTYGDMMTLLLTFFVLLFSMSSIDIGGFRALSAAFDSGAGVLEGGDVLTENVNMLGNGIKQFPKQAEEVVSDKQKQNAIRQVTQALQEYVDKENLQNKVTVEKQGDETILRFDDILLFDTGKADLKPGAIPVLNTLGIKLKEYLDQGFKLRFEGHTDNVPIKTAQFPSNWHLSASRAIAVTEFFVNEMGFTPSGISTEGFGEHNPIADNSTAEGRAMNRRVEIKISNAVMSEPRKVGE